MSYTAPKPVFIARKHGTSGLSGFWDALTVIGGGVQGAVAAHGGSTVYPGGQPMPVQEGPPWGLILGGAAVVGLAVVLMRRKG